MLREKEYKEYRRFLIGAPHKGIDELTFNSFINDSIISALKNHNPERGSLKTFMNIILNNKIKYYYIRKKEIYFKEIEEYNFIDDSEEYNYEYDENKKKLRKEIYSLPLNMKLISIFYFIDRVKTKDIAEVLDMNENTIKSRIHQAKKIITKNLC